MPSGLDPVGKPVVNTLPKSASTHDKRPLYRRLPAINTLYVLTISRQLVRLMYSAQ